MIISNAKTKIIFSGSEMQVFSTTLNTLLQLEKRIGEFEKCGIDFEFDETNDNTKITVDSIKIIKNLLEDYF